MKPPLMVRELPKPGVLDAEPSADDARQRRIAGLIEAEAAVKQAA